MKLEITHIDIVLRQYHPADISLRTKLPGTCVGEQYLSLHFKHNTIDDAMDYARKHFPGIPITQINTINQLIIEVDAAGKVETRRIT